MSLLANCHRDPKQRKQPYTPADFFVRPNASGQRPRQGQPLTVQFLHGLKPLFVKGKKTNGK